MKIVLEKNTPIHTDLVCNFDLFNNSISAEELLKLPSWKDDSNYSNYEHIDDFLKRDFTDKEMELAWPVRVPISYIWSSEKSKGGYDRPYDATNKGRHIQKQNLNTPNGGGNPKGYVSSDASFLSGILRPDNDGKWQIVKYIGNNRIGMKLLANRGENSEMLMELRFHKEGLSQSEYITIESERHTTDAGDRSGQNEVQKFFSSYRAQRRHAVHTFNFMKECKLNYHSLMQIEGVHGADDFLSLSSLSGIKDGPGNGFFKRFGETNVKLAYKTARDIASDITKEEVIIQSPIEVFAMMYKCFTEYGKKENSPDGLFSAEELDKFFKLFYARQNRQEDDGLDGNRSSFKLNDLTADGSLKCMVYLSANTFWPEIKNYWCHLRDTKLSFGADCEAMRQFMKMSQNALLKGDILNKVI